MQKIYILEDTLSHQRFFQTEILNFKNTYSLSLDIISINNFSTFIDELTRENLNDTDVFFIDIDLHHYFSGIDIAEKIRSFNSYCKIIFITSSADKALEIITKNITPFDFIEKSGKNIADTKNRLQETLKKCFQTIQQNTQQFLTLKRNSQEQIFSFADITYIETIKESRYRIYLQTLTEEYILNDSFSKIRQFDFPNYYLTSLKSYIINLKQIESLNKNLGIVTFKNNSELYVSSRIMKKITEALNKIV
ncbi:hypothetical protein BH739_01290 [Enterococcus casseliflavus]|nr:hypothetical protein BH739_01290 [Enterococcus casseliflavus]